MDHESQGAESDLHISDVIDVIKMDPDHSMNSTGNAMSEADGRRLSAEPARIVILEQPASKALRFRYECEGRSAGSIPGVNSTSENKTYPTIQILGGTGKAAVIVSCVTKDAPHRPHPHNLVGKEGCKRGVFSQHVCSKNMIVSFSNLGIQCVKKKDIDEALRVREEIRVDPFRTGFAHRSNPTGIDLNAVRLCFQVFLEGPEPNTYTRALAPVVSEPIYDKKAMSDLVICKLSDASASVAGGKEMILLCEKVSKDDIEIRFYEERDNLIVWEAKADFQPSQVHKQVAISFRTPRYERLEVDGPVSVCIQLRRPSDNATSEPQPFQMTPLDSDVVHLVGRKRQRYADDSLRHIQEHDKSRYPYGAPSPDTIHAVKNETPFHVIKKEPADASPVMYYGNHSPYGAGQSPVASPQMPGGRTPSPNYQAHSPFGMGAGPSGLPQQVYGGYPQQQQQQQFASHHLGLQGQGQGQGPPVGLSNRSVLLAGGSCTTAPNFSPDPVRPGSSGLGGIQHVYAGLGEPLNTVSMGLPLTLPGPVSPVGFASAAVDYDPRPHPHPHTHPSPSPNPVNGGGVPSYAGVDPIAPVLGVSQFELRELNLNSGDLCSLGPIGTGEGTLSEHMINSLNLSEAEPSCS